VRSGPADGPALVVLDPAGEAGHAKLPGTWRPLAEHLRIFWYRLPAGHDGIQPVRDLLADLPEPVHLIASGYAAPAALDLALARADVVRMIIAVDPLPPAGSLVDDAAVVEWWNEETAQVRALLRDRGITVRCFLSRSSDAAVRVRHPVPLGHPDVVGRLVETLLAADLEPLDDSTRTDVARAWHEVKEHVSGPMHRARDDGQA
jgi:pimeloyl-ACP methyl ester carboxylesterase